MGGAVSLVGQRHGRLVVHARLDVPGANSRWLCECDCGRWSSPFARGLLSGTTTSCGCVRAEVARRKFAVGYVGGARDVVASAIAAPAHVYPWERARQAAMRDKGERS